MAQEVPDAIANVVINRPIGPRAGPVAEVRRPTLQNPVQTNAHVRPLSLLPVNTELPHRALDPSHTLLGRARTQVPLATSLVVVRSERVAKEVEAFLSGIPHRGFGLIERKPE